MSDLSEQFYIGTQLYRAEFMPPHPSGVRMVDENKWRIYETTFQSTATRGVLKKARAQQIPHWKKVAVVDSLDAWKASQSRAPHTNNEAHGV